MAKQMVVVASIIFFAAVWMQATAQEPNVPAAAANIAPAAAAAGLNMDNADQVIGALKEGAPIPAGVFKNLGPTAEGPPKDSAAAATASAGTIVAAAGVVGSLFFV